MLMVVRNLSKVTVVAFCIKTARGTRKMTFCGFEEISV